MAAPPALPSASTSVARSRVGTNANHNPTPTAEAATAPREYDSTITETSTPIAGTASARDARLPSRREPAHRQAGIPSAAIRPVAFQ